MNTLTINISDIIRAIHAHTALMAVGARNKAPLTIPAILHDDHDNLLAIAARDAAAILCPQLLDAGITGVEYSGQPPAITFRLRDNAPDTALLRPPIEQAIKYMVLHIAYQAAGLSNDFRLIAGETVRALPTAFTPAAIERWP